MNKTLPHTRRRTSIILSTPGEVESSIGNYNEVVHHAAFLAGMGEPLLSSQICANLEIGYQIHLQLNLPISMYPIIQRGNNRQEKHCYLQNCVSQILAQLKVFTADYFLYQDPAKNGIL